MADTFARLYGATPYDPNDFQDQLGEMARQALLSSAEPVVMMVRNGQDMPALLGGLLVGTVQVLQATADSRTSGTDQVDAAIRTSIIQLAGWAVDMARSAEGREPLANV